ncbi:MAG: hypothetical protein ACLUR5_08295 [Eubacterium ventriosum]
MAATLSNQQMFLLMEKHQETAHCSLTHRRFQIIVLGKIQFGIKKIQKELLQEKGEAYDSSKIILTPGKTAKDLGFAWYTKNKVHTGS